jgi:hypothetical protein
VGVKPRLMHQPMGPVEVGVVRHDHRNRAGQHVGEAERAHAQIDGEDMRPGAEMQARVNQGKDQQGPQRTHDLAADIGARGRALLDLVLAETLVPEQPEAVNDEQGRHHVADELGEKRRHPDHDHLPRYIEKILQRCAPALADKDKGRMIVVKKADIVAPGLAVNFSVRVDETSVFSRYSASVPPFGWLQLAVALHQRCCGRVRPDGRAPGRTQGFAGTWPPREAAQAGG